MTLSARCELAERCIGSTLSTSYLIINIISVTPLQLIRDLDPWKQLEPHPTDC